MTLLKSEFSSFFSLFDRVCLKIFKKKKKNPSLSVHRYDSNASVSDSEGEEDDDSGDEGRKKKVEKKPKKPVKEKKERKPRKEVNSTNETVDLI